MTGPRPSTTLVCAECGKPLVRGARFCLACGKAAPVDAALAAAISGEGSLTLSDQEKQARLEQMLVEGTLGEFEILGELGRGGMATVYLAQDLALDRKVAIKVVSPSMLNGEGAAERFKREARTAAALSHPHIIPVHAVRELPNLLFFVMKFVEGRPLDEILRGESALDLRMVQTILFEVGQALAYAHRRGVVHRDIKPANIMLDGEGFSIVTDFGIAKPMQADSLTATGSMIGTPYYMSPEQCGGKPVSGASDQYSLGVVAYQMITGKRPFAGDTIMEILKGHFFETPAPILDTRPDCPPELAAVVERMLSKEVADRFASMDEALQAMACAPLTSDDPVRTQMIELARSSEKLQAIGRLKVPLSPVPLARSRAAISRSGSNPPQRSPMVPPDTLVNPAPAAPRRGWLIAGCVVLAVGSGLGSALLLRERAPHPTPSAPVDTTPAPAPAVIAPPPPPPVESTVVAPPADTAPVVAAQPPEPPKPDPKAVREAQRADIAVYIRNLARRFNNSWEDVEHEDMSPDDLAVYQIVIEPDGSVSEDPEVQHESRLTGEADLHLTNMFNELPPLPRSWGNRKLKLTVRYTLRTVDIRGPL